MAGWAGTPDFDLFQLPEEHQELRAAIRALATVGIQRGHMSLHRRRETFHENEVSK